MPAFWVGILYDDDALAAAWDMVKDWTAPERQQLRDDVPRLGLKAIIRGRTMLDLAKECLTLAQAGLKARKRLTREGRDETIYLEPLGDIVTRGTTPAEILLQKFHGEWHGSVEPVFTEYAY